MAMGYVIILQDFVIVTKVFKEVVVQVKNGLLLIKTLHTIKSTYQSIPEKSCSANCNNVGVCDSATGECSCNSGRFGIDCSSKDPKYFKLFYMA